MRYALLNSYIVGKWMIYLNETLLQQVDALEWNVNNAKLAVICVVCIYFSPPSFPIYHMFIYAFSRYLLLFSIRTIPNLMVFCFMYEC